MPVPHSYLYWLPAANTYLKVAKTMTAGLIPSSTKNNGSIRGSNTGPLADKLSTQGVTLSENHTTRPTERLM